MQAMSFVSVGFALGREGLFVLPHSAQAPQAVRLLTIPALTIPALALAFFVTAVIALVANPRDALVRLFSLFLLACTVAIAMDPLNQQGKLLSRAVEASGDGLGVPLFVSFCFAFPGQQADALSPAHPVWRYLRHYGMAIPVATALLSAAPQAAQDWGRAIP